MTRSFLQSEWNITNVETAHLPLGCSQFSCHFADEPIIAAMHHHAAFARFQRKLVVEFSFATLQRSEWLDGLCWNGGIWAHITAEYCRHVQSRDHHKLRLKSTINIYHHLYPTIRYHYTWSSTTAIWLMFADLAAMTNFAVAYCQTAGVWRESDTQP